MSRRDREADLRSLRRHHYAYAPDADESLGDVLDKMLHVEGVEADEPFERRALALISNVLDALDGSTREGFPDGIHYTLHCLADSLIEVGRRLEEAGPRVDNRADEVEAKLDSLDEQVGRASEELARTQKMVNEAYGEEASAS